MTQVKYRIYYSDGMTYDGPIENCPVFEVLVIVERDANHGRKLVSGGDFYTYDNGHWWPVDYFGMVQYLARPGWAKRVLVGVMVDEKIWNATMKRARYDPDFPDQTALHRYEPKAAF